MNITYLTRQNVFFENSASANRARSLLEGLAFLGVKICILVTDGFITKNERKEYKHNPDYGSFHFHYLAKTLNQTLFQRRINKFILFPLFSPFLYRKIKKFLCGSPNSILWTGCDLRFFKIVGKIKKRNSSIFTFIELSEYLNYQEYNRGNLIHKLESRRRQAFFDQKGFFMYDGIGLMTKALFNYYSNFPAPRPDLLHLPMTVDLDRFKIDCENTHGFIKPYIAFVGMMNNAKDGVDILIEAFAKIATQFKDYKLYLIGRRNYDTPRHLSLIKSLKLVERVFWVGEMSRNEIPPILINASLLVLSRPMTKQTQWGFPTKLGEYLATGNPVCVTRIGEIPDYLVDGESAYFADPGSIDSFADAMTRALSDLDKAKNVGLNGLRVAEKHFNMRLQSAKLFQFLHGR